MPSEGVPPEIECAIAMFASPLRAAILRRLAIGGPAPASRLAEALGVGTRAVDGNLTALEGTGAIAGNRPAGDRRGRPVTYTVDLARVAELAAALMAYVSGTEPPDEVRTTAHP